MHAIVAENLGQIFQSTKLEQTPVEIDRRFVRVLAAVLTDGLDAVEAAIGEALDEGAASDEVILNILSRRREPPRPPTIVTSADLALAHPPVADCARYDQLRDARAAA